ncbi:MAG: hypothetical protein ACXAEN_18345 [Candidatus Thorarchaeota archaeon]|jgi:hypothetical protein
MAQEHPPKGAQTVAGVLGAALVGAIIGGVVGAAIAAFVGFGLGVATEAEEAQRRHR